MLSIALFSECYHPMKNGVVVSVSSYATQLQQLGHQVLVFAPRHPQQAEEEIGVLRYPSITLPTASPYPIAIPFAPMVVKQALSSIRFDVIHSNSPMVMGHLALSYHRRRRIPLVFTYHTLLESYAHYFPLPQGWVRKMAVMVSRRYSNAVGHVIVPAAHVAERLRRYGVTTPITIIPTGIDLDQADRVDGTGVREAYGIPAGVPLLAFAGRIAYEKNILRVLTAFRLVLAREPDAHLLLIGGGPHEAETRAQCETLGIAHRTRLTGYVPREDVLRGLHAADLFVFASHTETQGLVIGEAMACRLPTVAVDADAPAEIITHGVEGLLTPDADEPFADAVVSLLRDPVRRTEMGTRARRRVEALSVPQCTLRLLDVYQQAITRAGEDGAGLRSVR